MKKFRCAIRATEESKRTRHEGTTRIGIYGRKVFVGGMGVCVLSRLSIASRDYARKHGSSRDLPKPFEARPFRICTAGVTSARVDSRAMNAWRCVTLAEGAEKHYGLDEYECHPKCPTA